jgi:outer membrane protein TolC
MNPALLALALAAGPTLTIDQALILAKQNPQIAQAQGALMQAQGQIGVARSGFLPSASASASVFGTTLNPGLQANDTFYPLYGSSVTLNQTLWDFGRTLGAYQAARDVERSARFDVENTWQQVELNVRTSYYVVLATQALVNVAQQTVDSNQKKLDLAKGLFEVGQRPRFDVTKAEVDLENSRISLLQAKNGVVLSRIALTQAIGRDVNDATLVFPELPPVEQPDVPALLHTAMENRPDLKSVELQILAAGETLDSLRSGWLPILGASATVRWNGTDTPLVNNWTAGATLTWPFLNGGAVLGRAESQTGVIAQVKAGRDLLLLQIRTDVEQAVATLGESRARRAVAKTLVVQARESLELASGRYQAGLGTIIELSDAQTSYSNAQAQEVKAVFDLATAWAQLKKATGQS